MVHARLGITMENIPGEVFQEIQGGFDHCDDGGLKFGVNEDAKEHIVDVIRRKAMELNRIDVEVAQVGTTIVTMKPRLVEQARTQEVVEETPEEFFDDIREEDEYEYQEEVPPEPTTATTAPEVTNETPPPIQHNETSPPIQQARRQAGINQVNYLPEITPLGEGNILTMIATTLESEISNLARNLQDKQAKFARDWTKVINLKREIDEATAPVEGHPLIAGLISQVNELREADNLIEEIFFIEGFVIVKTKELITDNEIEGHRRKIGRMMIKVDLKPIVGSSSESVNPIEIKNLDRQYFDGSKSWECGHVPSTSGMCWGTAWEQLFNAMALRDIPSVIEVVIRFIKNPNIADSYGRHIPNWPIAN